MFISTATAARFSPTEDESRALKEILKSVSEINSIANQNAGLAEYISTGSGQIAAITENLSSTVRVFKV